MILPKNRYALIKGSIPLDELKQNPLSQEGGFLLRTARAICANRLTSHRIYAIIHTRGGRSHEENIVAFLPVWSFCRCALATSAKFGTTRPRKH